MDPSFKVWSRYLETVVMVMVVVVVMVVVSLPLVVMVVMVVVVVVVVVVMVMVMVVMVVVVVMVVMVVVVVVIVVVVYYLHGITDGETNMTWTYPQVDFLSIVPLYGSKEGGEEDDKVTKKLKTKSQPSREKKRRILSF